MGTVRQYLAPEEALLPSSGFPQYVKNGNTQPVTGLAFDASNIEIAYWKFASFAYGSGPIACDLVWYADTSTTATQGVTWNVSIAAITPGVDVANVETKAFAAQHQGSTDLGSADPQRPMKTTIVISSVDNVAADDEVWLKVIRATSDAGDDLAGDAILVSVRLAYSDT